MIYINIDGTDYELTDEGATEQEHEDVGGVRRDAFDGTPRSSVERERRVFSLPFYEMDNTALTALRAKLQYGREFTVAGPFVPAGNYTGKITAAGFIHRGTGFRRGVVALIKQA